jgi:large subunit ribosomal protein L18
MNKNISRKRRIKRVRAKLYGTANCPRLCVFRSNQYVYAQVIDDENGKILISVDSRKISAKGEKAKNDIATAGKVGEEIAKLAQAKKISKVVFDKRSYKYHGKVKSLAEGARKEGLKF